MVTLTIAWSSPVFAIFPICLILGAALVGRFPRRGRDLIWFGGSFLSLFGLPVGVYLLAIAFHGGTVFSVIVGAAASVFLIVLCDVSVVMDAVNLWRPQRLGKINTDPGSV